MKFASLLCFLCALLFSVPSRAQDTNALALPPSVQTGIGFLSGVNDAHQVSVLLYPGYAPDLTVNGVHKPLGFGVAALYPLGEHAFTGLRLDYLGDAFFAPSANVGVSYQFNVFNRPVTAFGFTGAVFPLQGAGDETKTLGAIVGSGFYTHLWQSSDGKKELTAFAAVEKWTQFQGLIYRPGVALTIKF